MATRKANPVFALASARLAHGFGHVVIHVHELLGYTSATLKISCQMSDTSPGEVYAWDYGVSDDYAVLKANTLKNGYWLMKRINRLLDKERTEHGEPDNFADYALRILRAANVPRVHLLPGINPAYYGAIEDLPRFNPKKQGDALRLEIENMEQRLLSSLAGVPAC